MTAAAVLEAGDEAEALDWLHEHGCTDGLPVVIPTPERVARLVLASGLDADLELGEMGPGGGAATVEKVAVNAVMAGCLPDHVPIVVAVVRAILQPEFDLAEMQATTHSTAPLIIVGGDAARHCGVSGGFGALGPGHRANASIGRAVRLCMMNIGDARPGVSDMALLGHPGKFAMCLAEAPSGSPFEPVQQQFGYGPDESAVIVVGTEPPHSVMFSPDADDPDVAGRLVRALAASVANLGSNNANLAGGAVAIALNPEHAAVFASVGMTRTDVQEAIHREAANTRGELRALNTAFVPPGDDATVISAIRRPEDIVLFVAGGSGLYSAVFPSWAAGAHRNPVVHEPIVTGEACELPWAAAGAVS